MPRPSYPIVCFCAAVALLSALAAWEGAVGGLSNGPMADLLFPSLREAKQQRRQLDADYLAEQVRWQQRMELIKATAAGRVSLLDGAGRLRELYRAEPESVWINVRRRFPNASDEERYCRLLIGDVESYLRMGDPAKARSVVARLQDELQEHIRRGTLRLQEAGRVADFGRVAVPLATEKARP
jgi:hypothetical protein